MTIEPNTNGLPSKQSRNSKMGNWLTPADCKRMGITSIMLHSWRTRRFETIVRVLGKDGLRSKPDPKRKGWFLYRRADIERLQSVQPLKHIPVPLADGSTVEVAGFVDGKGVWLPVRSMEAVLGIQPRRMNNGVEAFHGTNGGVRWMRVPARDERGNLYLATVFHLGDQRLVLSQSHKDEGRIPVLEAAKIVTRQKLFRRYEGSGDEQAKIQSAYIQIRRLIDQKLLRAEWSVYLDASRRRRSGPTVVLSEVVAAIRDRKDVQKKTLNKTGPLVLESEEWPSTKTLMQQTGWSWSKVDQLDKAGLLNSRDGWRLANGRYYPSRLHDRVQIARQQELETEASQNLAELSKTGELTISKAAKKYNVSPGTLSTRLRKYSPDSFRKLLLPMKTGRKTVAVWPRGAIEAALRGESWSPPTVRKTLDHAGYEKAAQGLEEMPAGLTQPSKSASNPKGAGRLRDESRQRVREIVQNHPEWSSLEVLNEYERKYLGRDYIDAEGVKRQYRALTSADIRSIRSRLERDTGAAN